MPRGRSRDLDAHDRILDATFALLASPTGWQVRIDDIAAAANVGKQTIYRWWRSRDAVAIAALCRATMTATPFPDTGDLRADLGAHLRVVARLFASPTGALIRGIVGTAQHDPATAEAFVAGFWAPRRALSRARLEAAMARGDVRAGLDVELVLDTIYGALWTRLVIGHLPIAPRDADAILALVWPSIAVGPPVNDDGAAHPLGAPPRRGSRSPT
jgi:AcrR family transcriptional regulator